MRELRPIFLFAVGSCRVFRGISEYQNEVSSDKLEEDSVSEISEKELEMTDDDEEDFD